MKKNSYIFYIVLILLNCFGYSVFAQDKQNSDTSMSLYNNTNNTNIESQYIMVARSSVDYRVTPGDIYTLTYAAGAAQVTYTISVDASYRIRVSNLGIVNGAGKTFMQLKNEVETIVTNNYPLSGVQLVLTQPAIFRVYVKGEVSTAKEISVWALNRLSSLVSNNPETSLGFFVTSFASLRDISIRSLNGQTRVYDLFKARRLGDLSQDPYLRPGDEITFNQIKRQVNISGEVERPGTYQMLDGENLKELIEFYASGFTPITDKTRLELVRMVKSTDIAGDKIFLTEDDLTANYVLENYDSITVPAIVKLQPVMFVEGAIAIDDLDSSLVAANRLVIQFNQGETYASLVRKNTQWFVPVSDTQNAYILRNSERILINLNPMLYNAAYRDEILIQENDVLIIPFRQYFVTVAGAVVVPGRYPYIPDRNWDYYIALAGGFAAGRNTAQAVNIINMQGKRMKKTDAILPETIITARTNHALYYFNQYATPVITILSIVSTFLTIYVATGNSLK